jgi:hypothetical protein
VQLFSARAAAPAPDDVPGRRRVRGALRIPKLPGRSTRLPGDVDAGRVGIVDAE